MLSKAPPLLDYSVSLLLPLVSLSNSRQLESGLIAVDSFYLTSLILPFLAVLIRLATG